MTGNAKEADGRSRRGDRDADDRLPMPRCGGADCGTGADAGVRSKAAVFNLRTEDSEE